MFFDENLVKLNAKLAPHDLEFVPHEGRLRLVEKVMYRLNNLPRLKDELKDMYNLRFHGDSDPKYWYIGNEGIKKLSQRSIKYESKFSEDELMTKLGEYIAMISEDTLKQSIENTFSENEFYYECPAAIYYHHSYLHGLLEHSLQVTKSSLSLVDSIDDDVTINKDIIIAGSLLHDIGKINCYQFVDGGIDACGLLSEQDHIANGIKIISQYLSDCPDLDHLIHILASHHRKKEFGAIVEPISNEAWIISVADELSSKIQG